MCEILLEGEAVLSRPLLVGMESGTPTKQTSLNL